jgi:hypothetical protein
MYAVGRSIDSGQGVKITITGNEFRDDFYYIRWDRGFRLFEEKSEEEEGSCLGQD